jgi:hypothetical protein
MRVFENKVLRRISGMKRNEVMERWGKVHHEDLCDLYASPSIIIMIKWRRMRWAGHVAQIGRRRMHVGYWSESQRERDN